MGNAFLLLLLVAISVVLLVGIFLMGRGGAANEKYGNKLMMARVVLQALILIVVALIFVSKE